MYSIVLGVHSWNRWVLLLSLVFILIRSISGEKKGLAYKSIDHHFATILFWALNLQFVLGFVLYIFFSPYTYALFSNFSEVMSNSSMRFFVIEHPFAMFLAVGAGHAGLRRAKQQTEDVKKHRYMIQAAAGCLFFILIGIPWPFLPYGRALFFL
ncbi:MAG: hypothetical protein AB8G77_04120 [Rhodothermales bacterium]